VKRDTERVRGKEKRNIEREGKVRRETQKEKEKVKRET